MQSKCTWKKRRSYTQQVGLQRVIHSIAAGAGRPPGEQAFQQLSEGRQFTIPTMAIFPQEAIPTSTWDKLSKLWEKLGCVQKVESMVPYGTKKLHKLQSVQGFQDLLQTYTTSLMSCTHQVFHPHWITHH